MPRRSIVAPLIWRPSLSEASRRYPAAKNAGRAQFESAVSQVFFRECDGCHLGDVAIIDAAEATGGRLHSAATSGAAEDKNAVRVNERGEP